MDVEEVEQHPGPGPTEQKMLVQWCMSAQFFSEAALREAILRINGTAPDDELQELVEKINTVLTPFSLALRSGMAQTSGDRYWAVVSTNADAISALGTAYTPTAIGVLRHIIELVFTDSNYSVDLHVAVREAVAKCPSSSTRRDAEEMVEKLAGDGWLEIDGRWVMLGLRACIELEPYLSDAYPDCIRSCCLCKEMATRGMSCAECLAVLHPHCYARLATAKALACPACHRRMVDAVSFGPATAGVATTVKDEKSRDASDSE